MKEFLDLFNWKKYPANVFYTAIPVATLGFLLLLTEAILFIRYKNDWWYLAIFISAFLLMVVALYPVYKGYNKLCAIQVKSPNASVS